MPSLQGEIQPVVGSIYTIREFGWNSSLRLSEIVNQPRMYAEGWGEAAFYAARFRPLTESKSSISFTTGADPSSDQFDNRRKVWVRA